MPATTTQPSEQPITQLIAALHRYGVPGDAITQLSADHPTMAGGILVDCTAIAADYGDGEIIVGRDAGWDPLCYRNVDDAAVVLAACYHLDRPIGRDRPPSVADARRAAKRVDRALLAHPEWTPHTAWEEVWEYGWTADPAPTPVDLVDWVGEAAVGASDPAIGNATGPQVAVAVVGGRLEVTAVLPPEQGSWQPDLRRMLSLERPVDYAALRNVAADAHRETPVTRTTRARVVDELGRQVAETRRTALAEVMAQWLGRERWTADQCATHCGIAASTWRDYVADRRAPRPVGHDPAGRQTWDAEAVRTWHAQRPGRGARTDLRPRA